MSRPDLREKRGRTIAKAGLLLLVLFCLVERCSPLGGPRVRTILPADKAVLLDLLPKGRYIVHAAPSQKAVMLLDVATGQDMPIPKGVDWVAPLDDNLLYGASDNGKDQFVVNVQPLAAVTLEPLPGGSAALPGAIREADGVYAIETGTASFTLFLLKRDPSAGVISGHYIEGVRNLDTLLVGIRYKTPPLPPVCALLEKAPSPDGQCYYYIDGSGLRIYSRQGELLNTDSRQNSRCYGWAWDSSGVYVQERWGGLFAPSGVGPLQLLLAKP